MDPMVDALMKQKQPRMSAALPGTAAPYGEVSATELPFLPGVGSGIVNAGRAMKTLAPEAQALMKDEMVRRYLAKFVNAEGPGAAKSVFQKMVDAGQFAGDRTTGSFTEGPGGLASLGGYLGKLMGR